MKTIIKSNIALLLLAIAIGLASCKGEPKKEVEATPEEKHSEAVVEISVKQMETVGIELGKIEMKNLNSVVKTNGQLNLLPQNKADVNSLAAGIVKRITVAEGSFVKQGQTLALLENLDIVKLQENYLTLKKELVYSKQEYERQQELDKQNAGTGKVFQQTEAKYEVDKARVIGLEMQLRQLNIDINAVADGKLTTQIPITAPISGVIGEIHIKTGSYVDMQTSLMEISDNTKLQADLQVFEKDFPKLEIGQTVEMGITNMAGKTLSGTVYGINQSFEDDSKGIIVHVKINNSEKVKLLPGMYVSALISVGNQSVQAVPSDAIVDMEGRKFVFLLTKEEKEEASYQFQKVEVATGVSELGFVEITPLDELPENATIITKGAFYVMSKMSGGEEEEE